MTTPELEDKLLNLERRFEDHRHTGVDSQEISIPEVSSSVTVYDATVVDVEDTTAEVDIISFNVPANTVSDGDVIKVNFLSKFKYQGSAGASIITIKAKAQAAEVTLHDQSNNSSATEYKLMAEIIFQRVGSELWVLNNTSLASPFLNDPQSSLLRSSTLTESGASQLLGWDFTTDSVFSISVEFSEDTTNYWRVGAAKAYKI